MAIIVLTLHLIVSICLIGLVLLQRSEGGALGVGGGGGGALMSGRGAADALAKMTTVAGGIFLATSLLLTVIAGVGRNDSGSVFDNMPSLPAISTPAPAPADPAETTPDPTQSNAIQAAPETQQASAAPAITLGPASASAATAGPIQRSETPAPATTTRTAAPGAPVSTAAPRTTTTTQTQQTSAPATVQPRPQPLVIPNTSGSAGTVDSGVAADFTDESSQGVQPVRRERAGPDQ